MPFVYSPPNSLGSLNIAPGAPGIDTTKAGALVLGRTMATSVEVDPVLFASSGINIGITLPPVTTNAILSEGIAIYIAGNNSSVHLRPRAGNDGNAEFYVDNLGNIQISGHIVSNTIGVPATSALGANVTSATFTGNDTRGTITIVMAAGLAANTRVCTATFAATYGATPPKVTLVDQTSGVGLAIVNSYVLAQATGVSFDIAFDQALVAGTYIIDYIVIG